MEVKEGDNIEVVSNKVDQPSRFGVVQRIIEEDPLRLEVAWDDGHTTIFAPAAGNMLVQPQAN